MQPAGRAHAVYGTQGFDVRLLEAAEHPLLVAVIGTEAERLVYRCGACDRDRDRPTLATDGGVHNRFTGIAEELSCSELRDFAGLSLVNEIDVAEHAPGSWTSTARRSAGSRPQGSRC